MGRRIFTIALWTLVAILIVRTCMPAPDEPEVAVGAPTLEDWSQPGPGGVYPLVLENSKLRSEWSAQGAGCGRVLLKEFRSRDASGEAGVEDFMVVHDSGRVLGKGPAAGAVYYRQRDAFRLTEVSELLLPPDPVTGVQPNLDGVEWQVERSEAGDALSFRWTARNGVTLIKSVRLAPDAYHFEAEVTAVAPAAADAAIGQRVTLRLGTGGGIAVTRDPYYRNPWVAAGLSAHGQLDDVDFFFPGGALPPSRSVAKRWSGAVPLVAEGSKYFINAIHAVDRDFDGAVAEVFFDDGAFVADNPAAAAGARGLDPSRLDYWKRASVGGAFSLFLAAPSSSESKRFRWYVGPKDAGILDEAVYGPLHELPDRADYGTSWFYKIFLTPYVAPAILGLLKAFQALVGNWGVAIILLTVLVRALVFPITRHSQVKMAEYSAKMQKVKPMLDAVNQKHANDPQKKQAETLKIYQQHRLTPPVGGCLPIFLQMPVFIGLFAALRSSLDLRMKPFAGWIEDLSVPDALVDFGGPVADFFLLRSVTSLNLLPLLMVTLWILHQRSMPKPTDPQQLQMYKIMAFMPVMFGLLLYNYAAGLSLYMITSSAIGIFEQKVIRKHWPVPTPAAAGSVIPPPGRKARP